MISRFTYSRSRTSKPAERFDRGLWASVLLHVVLGMLLVLSPALFPAFGDVPWGSEAGGGGGISMRLVADESGIPLPAPDITNPDAVGNESTGLFAPLEEAAPAAVPDEAIAEAELVPETFEEIDEVPVPEPDVGATSPGAPTPSPPAPAPVAEAPPAPDNAIPFGEGGQPDIGAGFATTGGTYGVDVGDGTFGQQYGRYVNAMRRRVSENWYQSMIEANVQSGARVTMEFEILRNGLIQSVSVVESSGIRSLDDSAERAIYRVRQLEPLPPTYRGASIDVQFWFEFTR